jgi:hypothetical protein
MKIALRVTLLQTACDSGMSLGIGLNIDEPLLISGVGRMFSAFVITCVITYRRRAQIFRPND